MYTHIYTHMYKYTYIHIYIYICISYIYIQKVGDEVTRIDGRAVHHAITTNNDGRASISILSQMLQGAEGSYVTLLISRHGQPPQEPLVCCNVCCSVLQCVAVCCSVLQCAAVCCSVLQCVAVCCSVLQCVAVCCSVVQCVAVCCSVLPCVAVCCSVLQRDAASCSVLMSLFISRRGESPHEPLVCV